MKPGIAAFAVWTALMLSAGAMAGASLAAARTAEQETDSFSCDCRTALHGYCALAADSIPDGTGALVVPIWVPYEYILMDVDVCLEIRHPQVAEISVELVGPGGAPQIILAAGGPGGADYACTIFDDGAATSILQGSAPFTGGFRPVSPLTAFTGVNGIGEWQLVIRDSVPGHRGRFYGACLNLVGTSCLPLTGVVAAVESDGRVTVHWPAPERQLYQVWSSVNPQNDGDPRFGDPDWQLEAELFLDPGSGSWADPWTPDFYKTYVVTRTCEFSVPGIVDPGRPQTVSSESAPAGRRR